MLSEVSIVLWSIFCLCGIAAFAVVFVNQYQKWKKPWMYKGDTGIPGMTGAQGIQGPPGVCQCATTPEVDPDMTGRTWDKPWPRTKEDAYGLPPVEPEIN